MVLKVRKAQRRGISRKKMDKRALRYWVCVGFALVFLGSYLWVTSLESANAKMVNILTTSFHNSVRGKAVPQVTWTEQTLVRLVRERDSRASDWWVKNYEAHTVRIEVGSPSGGIQFGVLRTGGLISNERRFSIQSDSMVWARGKSHGRLVLESFSLSALISLLLSFMFFLLQRFLITRDTASLSARK
jgi:hypothetical protein